MGLAILAAVDFLRVQVDVVDETLLSSAGLSTTLESIPQSH